MQNTQNEGVDFKLKGRRALSGRVIDILLAHARINGFDADMAQNDLVRLVNEKGTDDITSVINTLVSNGTLKADSRMVTFYRLKGL